MSRCERGSGTVLTAGVALALLAVAWASAVIVGWVAQARDAQDAADLAALAGASAMAQQEDACRAAGEAARRNGAVVAECEVRGEWPHFVVEVTVSRTLTPALPGYPVRAVRSAAAGSA